MTAFSPDAWPGDNTELPLKTSTLTSVPSRTATPTSISSSTGWPIRTLEGSDLGVKRTRPVTNPSKLAQSVKSSS